MKPQVSELADKIRDSASTGGIVETELSTSQRIIARVTDGIYREPWAAFRELIANAYDADASRVVISTGAPDFKQITVRDDGRGMSPEALAYVLKSIGGSSKRTETGKELRTVNQVDPEFSPGGRALIGKIGIGLFAVAQLTQHFQIITKSAGSNLRHSATIKLTTHSEAKKDAKDEEFVAGMASISSEVVDNAEIESHGTAVILYDLRPDIRSTLRSNQRWRLVEANDPDSSDVHTRPTYHIGVLADQLHSGSRPIEAHLPWDASLTPAEKFQNLVAAASNSPDSFKAPTNLAHFDSYLRLIWNLSLALPLPYVSDDPLEKKGDSGIIFLQDSTTTRDSIISIPARATVREHFSLPPPIPHDVFDVLFDDVLLRRPIHLPNEVRRKSRVPAPMLLVGKIDSAFANREIERAGGQLSFHAYLYWNSKIVPKETSGALIRVRGASGTLFDRTFLNYQVSEQNRLSQITCEIFVDQGLDAAINIDRESFNFSHPHYLFLQRWLHNALKVLINKNKQIASEDLKKERSAELRKKQDALIARALEVWHHRRGNDADEPFDLEQVWPSVIGDASIQWNLASLADRNEQVGLAITLEAYEALSGLDHGLRSAIISDILRVLGDGR